MSTETAGIPGFYGNRPSVAVVEARERLSNVRKLNLSESQRAEILSYEKDLTHRAIERGSSTGAKGEKVGLEEIYEMWNPDDQTATFYLEYFREDEGKRDAKEILGIDLDQVTELHQIEALLCTYDSRHLDDAGVKKMLELGGRSRKYAEARLYKDFEKADYGADLLAFDSIVNPPRITIITGVSSFVEQVAKYAELRSSLRAEARVLGETIDTGIKEGLEVDFAEGKNIVLDIHRKRLNTLIVNRAYPSALHLLRQYGVVRRTVIESDLRTKEGRKAYKVLRGLEEAIKELDTNMELAGFGYKKANLPLEKRRRIFNMKHQIEIISRESVSRNLRRLDIFRNGAGSLKQRVDTKTGEAIPLSGRAIPLNQELRDLAEGAYTQESEVEGKSRFSKAEIEKLEKDEQGVDYWRSQVDAILEHTGLLTADDQLLDGSTTRPNDNLWRSQTHDVGKIANVDKNKHAVLIGPRFLRSLKKGILVMIHEYIHVVQHKNREELPLEIFKKVGTARSGIYFEAGAIAMQSEASEVLFGERRNYLPHFLMAIEAKLNGGTLKDTIKAFYDSDTRMNPNKKKKDALELSISSARRLFGNGGDFDDSSENISNSTALEYLEQELLAIRLKDMGLEALIFLGIDIDTYIGLLRLGLDLDQIKIPEIPYDLIESRLREQLV